MSFEPVSPHVVLVDFNDHENEMFQLILRLAGESDHRRLPQRTAFQLEVMINQLSLVFPQRDGLCHAEAGDCVLRKGHSGDHDWVRRP